MHKAFEHILDFALSNRQHYQEKPELHLFKKELYRVLKIEGSFADPPKVTTKSSLVRFCLLSPNGCPMRGLEEGKVVFPRDGLPQPPPEQSRFVNPCQGWAGQGFPSTHTAVSKKASICQQRLASVCSPASSPVTHPVMPHLMFMT